jgi:sarcosine oxidase
MPHYDAIVLGAGGVGSAALYHLARRGLHAAAFDQFPVAHGRGSSHGRTRIIRKAYYEHPDYVPLALRAYELWTELSELRRQTLIHRVGLLQIGPADGSVLGGVMESARRFGLSVESLDETEISRRFPALRVPSECGGVYEADAGWLPVEACVAAHLEEAARLGAEIHTSAAVVSWHADASGATVVTTGGSYTAPRLVIAAGAWSHGLLADAALPLAVLRKPQYWYAADERFRAERNCPAFLYELPEEVFYGLPQVDEWGVKLARHTGGQPLADPAQQHDAIDAEDQRLVEQFAQRYLAGVTRNLRAHDPCLYTMSPDHNFLVGRHPRWPHVVLAAGLSGHGFKFTPVLGLALAELAIDGRSDLPIGFLDPARFAQPNA